MALTATSLCVGALRKGPPMWPPAQPSVVVGQGAGATACSRTGAGNGEMWRRQIPLAIPARLRRTRGQQRTLQKCPPGKAGWSKATHRESKGT